jgi:thymidylate kinase/glycosyltransferase involved in cell wall biosynthesis
VAHSAPRRVLIVTDLSEGADEGMRNWTRQLHAAAAAGRFQVETLRLGGDPRLAAFRPGAWRAVRRAAPDVVAYVPYSGLTPKALLRLRALCSLTPRAMRAIVILQARDWPGRRGAPPADLALAASSRLASACRDVAPVVMTVPPVIDAERFSPPTGDTGALKAELGLDPDRPLVLHVGHLKASRNLGVLGELAGRGEHQVVVIASTSTEADPAVRRGLEQNGVRVLREFLPDIERYYQAADVYLFPVVDPLGCSEVPQSVLEALAVETPVVATRFGALPELLPPSPAVHLAAPSELIEAVVERRFGRDDALRDHIRTFTPQRLASAFERALARGARGRRKHAAIVQISGVDGAGKSTQVERMLAAVREHERSVAALWCRWDPWLARPAVRLLDRLAAGGGEGQSGATSGAPRDRRRRLRGRVLDNMLMRRLWLALMIVDYGLVTAARVRRRRREVDVLILDRYWHDVLVDFSAGGSLAHPPWLLRRLLPDPDLMLVLDLPVETALERQTEGLDSRYFEDRRALYRAVVDRYGAVVVDASVDIDTVANEISERIAQVVAADPGTQSR